jgi:hypothetical protein
VERRGSFGRDGHLSVTAWLVGRFRLAWSAANEDVHAARALRSMTVARASSDPTARRWPIERLPDAQVP